MKTLRARGRKREVRDSENAELGAEADGFELVRVFVEVETGKGSDAIERRPQLAAALAEARRKRCSIGVAKLDRLSRDVHFISGLMTRRSSIGCSATDRQRRAPFNRWFFVAAHVLGLAALFARISSKR